MTDIVNNIFAVDSKSFEATALEIFRYQYSLNAVYREWVKALKVKVEEVNSIAAIPFLPISFFKSSNITTGAFEPQLIFTSSGTTGQATSKHLVKDKNIYIESFIKGFSHFYGNIEEYCIIALLPSYLERQGSSLVMMADHLINLSKHPSSGFYLYNLEQLSSTVKELEEAGQKTVLIGVTFALLDFAKQFPMHIKNTVVMDTGGMKGRKREMIRDEVHAILKKQLGVKSVHSEYGMTELLSQAYSKGDGRFETVPWMKILVRDDEDPLSLSLCGKGLINVIDLANIYSCSFIATDDIGRVNDDNTFEVIGRMDNSDIRGCSLLIT